MPLPFLKFLRVRFIFSLSFFLFLSLYAQPLQFARERIEVEVRGGECILNGTYYFRNNGYSPLHAALYYPFIITPELPFTFHKPGLPLGRLTVQVWPDSTVTLFLAWNQLTGLAPQPGSTPIAGFELMQNYPNPFNPVTTIEFTIPVRSRVSLTIYNLAGETVDVPVSGELSSGIYRVQWDGSKMASGIYFYRLQAESQSSEENRRGIFTDIQKMILLK